MHYYNPMMIHCKTIQPATTIQPGRAARLRSLSDLVARDEQGKPYTVRYDAVNAMLLNEFLKEHRKVEQLEKQNRSGYRGLTEGERPA